ncbi:MAG: ribonuclease Y [Deltaproteobacteria bacterium]|nr:ribonuclease Y [Deltaproteobacteria bacterium]MBN2670425.1 ribonuclease Y [Deltaproteobacteria bacterium]
MEPIIYGLLGIVGGLVGGLFVGRMMKVKNAAIESEDAKKEADQLLDNAKREAEKIRQDGEIAAREEKMKILASVEKETEQLKKEISTKEKTFRSQEDLLNKKKDLLASKEIDISKREAGIERTERTLIERKRNLDKKIVEVQQTVERKAGLSREEAKKELIESITDEAKRQAALSVREIEEEAKEEAETRAKRIIGVAVQRYAGEHIQERAVSVIHLPNDELKGRIIGREGRNIRALEAATGIDLIVDDTPETVVISGFDPVRREVARLSLERLIQDGRIHPSRIEEIVSKARNDVNKAVKDAGEQAILELGLARVHPEIVKMLGRLKFRYSYAQNVLRHSVECGFIAGMMAAELGLNQRKARRAGLLHDIGKAMTHEIEGSHAVIGAQFAKKHKEEALIVNAIASHHEDEAPTSVIAHLVAAADALSGARPGARREMLESYVKRLENLENICKSFDGVSESYAIQAGREVRVLVENESISDNDAVMLSKDIAARIESELTYPGQIQVTVIRETRAIATAK